MKKLFITLLFCCISMQLTAANKQLLVQAREVQQRQVGAQPTQQPTKPLNYYTEPGIIGNKNGRWIGSDHLYNLTDEIGIVVEIVRLPDVKQTLDETIIEKNVLDIFKKAGLRAFLLKGGQTPPLPYYHVLIITMPMPNGKVGYVSARLFENVNLPRVQLAEGIFWQGITWESQTLVQASNDDFAPHIYEDVNEITRKFVDRYKHFEEMKKKLGK